MKPMPQAVLRSLERSEETHPPADLLAAFSEKRLPALERKFVLDHIAACMECREVLALAAPEPELTSVVVRPRATFWRPVLSWGGIAAAIVVAISLLVMNDNDRSKIAKSPQTINAVVIAKNTTDIPSGFAARDLPEQTRSTRQATQPALASKLPSDAPKQPRTFDSLSDLNQLNGNKAMKDATAANGNAANAEMAEAKKVDAISATAAQSANAPVTQSAPAPQMRESFAPSVNQDKIVGERKNDRYPHWTLDSDGTLLRASNANGSWEKISIPGNTVMLHAIATIGSDVWVGGASGVVYHSADAGADWIQVKASANGATLADDVINIEFTSAQQGSLTTSRQQTWTTNDGGQSWNVH